MTSGTVIDTTANGDRDVIFMQFDFSGGGATVPSAVIDLAGAPGDTQVGLTWSAPADGGSAITDYTVEYGITAGFPGNAAVFADGVSASTGATVTGLTNSTNYSFRVFTVNGIGTSTTSNVATATPIGGGGGGGGGGTFTNLNEPLAAPTIDTVEVLDPNSIRYNWNYSGANHFGFRIIDQNITQIAEPSSSARSYDLENLDHNTVYAGPTIKAYNASKESAAAGPWDEAVTFMPPVTPKLFSRNGDVMVGVNEDLNNVTEQNSGLRFEYTIEETVNSSAITESEWVQNSRYSFSAPMDKEVKVRVKARNQVSVETEWSDYLVIPAGEALPVDLLIGLSLQTIGGGEVPTPVDPNSILFATISLQNSSDQDANDVFINLPLPQYLNFVPGSLQVGGNIQTNSPDQDFGQGNSGAVSVIFPEVVANEIKIISFQLAFDVEGLELLASEESIEEQIREEILELEEEVQTGQRTDEGLLETASVFASATNPIIQLQASVSASNLANSVFSNVVSVEPDLLVFSPVSPVTPPTPTPTLAPTPSPTPAPAPTAPATPATGGGSAKNLLLTGNASSSQDLIEFTGTTSEPNSTIVVTFNNRVTRTLTSDENGVWQTFVSANELGIQPGETADIEIRGVAQKDDLTSNTVVQNVSVTRAMEGEVIVEIDEQVSEESFIETLIEEQEQIIETTLVVSAPIILASSLPLWGYLPYLPTLFLHLISWLFGLFRKEKKGRLFGIVYDSITKQPLPLAIVRVYDTATKKLIKTEVTNKEGRYEFLLKPGQYTLEAKKPTYFFPSKIVSGSVDGEYQHVYNVTAGLDVTPDKLALPDLPLDPQNAKRKFQLANIFKKLWIGFQSLGHFLALPMLFIGALVSIVSVVVSPDNIIYWILAIVYVLMLTLQLIFREHKEKAWGIVYEVATNAALPLVSLQLIDPEFGKVVKSRLSDYEGRFSFLPEPGKYVIKANKEGYSQPEVVESRNKRKPLSGEVQIQKKDERITGDIGLVQQ